MSAHSKHILHIISRFMSFNDGNPTDNPLLRSFDISRKLENISINNPLSANKTIAPNETMLLFDGTLPSGLTGSSVLNMQLVSSDDNVYRLQVTSGPASFRTERTVSGINNVNVTVNNNIIAVFDFVGATLTGVQVGDIMRVSGSVVYDTGPFVFNPLNTGIWVVIGVSGTQVTVRRPVGKDFVGVSESVTGAGSQVMFYSASGIQTGHKFNISGTFNIVSHRTFQVLDATPTWVDFVSTVPLPEESGLTYVPSTIVFYENAKSFIYLEVSQDASVKLNGDTTDNVLVSPIRAGNCDLPGIFFKWGDTFSCSVTNRSINPLEIRYLTAE